MKVKANGKTFTFPEGTSHEEIGLAIDDYFAQNPVETPQERSEPQPDPSLFPGEETMDTAPQEAPVAPQEQPQKVSRHRAAYDARNQPLPLLSPSVIDEFHVGDSQPDASWEDIIASDDFRSLPPMDKRRMADEYFNRNFAPEIPLESLEEERERFHQSSGLAKLTNFEGKAKESRGLLDKASDYWDTHDKHEMIEDTVELGMNLGKTVGRGVDYLAETPLTEMAGDALSLGKKVAGSLYDVGKDLTAYGADVVFGMPDDEFMERYGVSKAEYTDSLGSVERFQLQRQMDELDRKNIDKALKREGVADEDIDVAKVRTEANQKASDVIVEGAIDVATMVPALRMARAGVAGSRLAKVGEVAKDTAAVGGGEVAKNVYQGRPLDENVLESMAINAGISTPLALRGADNQATRAVESVREGRKAFEDTMKDLGKSEKFLDRKNDILTGARVTDDKAFKLIEDPVVKDALNEAATLVPRKFDDATRKSMMKTEAGKNEVRKQEMWEKMQTQTLTDTLNDLYKKGLSKEDFVKAATAQSKKMKADLEITPSKTGLEAFYDLKKGLYDDTFDITRNKLRTDASQKISKSGDVDNYMRALEFDALSETGFLRRHAGRMATGVAGSKGLNALQRGVSNVADFASFGVGPEIRRRARAAAGERMTSSAQEVMGSALGKARSDALYEATFSKNVSDTLSKVESVKNMDEFNALVKSDPEVAKALQGYQFIEPDPVRFNTPELREKSQLDFLKMELGDQLRSSKRHSEGPSAQSLDILERLEGKKSFSEKDLMDLSNPIHSFGYPLAKESLESKNVLDRHKPGFAKADTAKTDSADKAAAALYRQGQQTAAKSGAANMAVSAFLYLTPLPSATIQASIQILNTLLSARQKRGLVEANKILKKHYAPMKEAEIKFNKGKISQEEFDKVQNAYLKDVNKVGEGKFIQLLGHIEEAAKFAERVKEED